MSRVRHARKEAMVSSVRMCDKCGDIFSENAEGWETGTMSKMVRDQYTGEARTMTLRVDACVGCASIETPAQDTAAVPSGIIKAIRAAVRAENKVEKG